MDCQVGGGEVDDAVACGKIVVRGDGGVATAVVTAVGLYMVVFSCVEAWCDWLLVDRKAWKVRGITGLVNTV